MCIIGSCWVLLAVVVWPRPIVVSPESRNNWVKTILLLCWCSHRELHDVKGGVPSWLAVGAPAPAAVVASCSDVSMASTVAQRAASFSRGS